MKHPAKYNNKFLPIFSKMLVDSKLILDPFGGTGKIFELKKYLPEAKIIATELEPEWANCIVADALNLPFQNNFFDSIVTFPTYGNRMADHHNAKDGSNRNTYTHVLGRKLSNNNSGAMQWGEEYKQFHKLAWTESKRVLRNDGLFILNIKDHIRKGVIQEVTNWHIECLENLGFELLEHIKIPLSGNGFGRNGNVRVDYESIVLFRLTP